VQRQTYGYLPSSTVLPLPLDRYSFLIPLSQEAELACVAGYIPR